VDPCADLLRPLAEAQGDQRGKYAYAEADPIGRYALQFKQVLALRDGAEGHEDENVACTRGSAKPPLLSKYSAMKRVMHLRSTHGCPRSRKSSS
jgi:hypothetical protein